MTDAKRWRERINGAEITDYDSTILSTNSLQGQVLANSFCSCGARIDLNVTG